MGRHRALLIGASNYEMHGVTPLPFIPHDLTRLGSTLEERGFDEVQILAARERGRQISANYVNARVTGFLRRARAGDTLFILLSGHGVHAKGRDYLVPEDIDEDTHPFESGCVPIDWSAHLDETPASHVIFLIDACREGIEQETMGLANVRQWSRQKISAALRRKVAYVYACSPAQLALFVRRHESPIDPVAGVTPGESFSLFSRSVSDVISAQPEHAALSLDGFQAAVQDRMTQLHRAYRKRGEPQNLRVVTDIQPEGFYLLPTGNAPASHSPRPGTQAGSTYPAADATMGVSAGSAEPKRVSHTLPAVATETEKPDATRSPQDRRWSKALLALPLLGMLATTAWTVIHYTGKDDTKTPGAVAPTSSAPTSPSQGTSATDRPASSGAPDGTGGWAITGSTPDGTPNSRVPSCSATVLQATLKVTRISYGVGEEPIFEMSIKNSSTTDCRKDLGPLQAILTIRDTSDDLIWSSAHCHETATGVPVRVPALGTVTKKVTWNRQRSLPQCATPATRSAPPGTYLVEAQLQGLAKPALASFAITSD
ncbi:caspase family protein [Streptomyces sp. NPDC003863]